MSASHNVDSYKFLSIQRLCFIAIGIDLYGRPTTEILKYPVLFLVQFTATLVLLLAMGAFTVKYFDQVDEAVKVLTVLLQSLLAILKSLMFLARSRQYIRVIDDLNQMAMQACITGRQLWIQANETQKMFSKFYFITTCVAGSLYLLVPLVYTVINHFNGKDTYILPINAIYPYDYNTIPWYTFTWLWCSMVIAYDLFAIVGMDSIFCWFVYNSAAHFQILREQLRNIANELDEDNFEHFRRRITYTFAYHRRFVELIKEFRTIFAPIIFIEVSMSCLKLCFIVMEISINIEPMRLFVILLVMAIVCLQLMVYCIGGEKLKQESELFSESIYLLFPWERLTPQMKRLILLPLMRSQRVETLSGYIFVVDRNLMVWVCKTAGSVISVMSAVKEKQEQ